MWEFNYSARPLRVIRRVSKLPKRIYFLNKNSIPFISGDAFADNADFQAYGPRYRSVRNQSSNISEAQVIFCPGHMVEQLVEEYGKSISARILILGNSDREYEDFDFKIPKSVKHIFAQNMLFSNSAMATGIPIGIENLRLNTNGHTSLFKPSVQSYTSKILVGPFGMTHPERLELQWLQSENVDEVSFIQKRLSPSNYSRLAQDYSFIAAPRGNGIDTHRLWETLYRGAIPLVRDTVWLSNFPFLSSIVIKMDSWTKEEIKHQLTLTKAIFSNPREIPALWWPYWRGLIKSKF
jgi:hypothetical protein